MKSIATGLVILPFFVASAVAAESYQIIPFVSLDWQGEQHYHALRVNIETGETVYCVGIYNLRPAGGRQTIEGNCQTENAKIGSMGTGPAVLSPSPRQLNSIYTAIWKVDQSSGAVTFCVRGAEQNEGYPQDWYCKVLPKR